MIKLEFEEAELQALVGLLDAGVKAVGLRAVVEAAALIQKIDAAAKEAANAKDSQDG